MGNKRTLVFKIRIFLAGKITEIFTAIIKIKVDDVNDNSPRFTEAFYKFSIPENSKNGLLIGTVKAGDLDVNRTMFYLLDKRQPYSSLVHLDEASGEILVASKLDREANEWINLTVSYLIYIVVCRYNANI